MNGSINKPIKLLARSINYLLDPDQSACTWMILSICLLVFVSVKAFGS